MAVAAGGTLDQHLPDTVGTDEHLATRESSPGIRCGLHRGAGWGGSWGAASAMCPPITTKPSPSSGATCPALGRPMGSSRRSRIRTPASGWPCNGTPRSPGTRRWSAVWWPQLPNGPHPETGCPRSRNDLHVYDTTLRDGAQQEGSQPLRIGQARDRAAARRPRGRLHRGGWPGANPKDTEFFRRAQRELTLRNATLAAFGATRRAGVEAADDPLVRALLDSGASVVTLVAKSHVGTSSRRCAPRWRRTSR
jgi:hypothetical protein